jgi:hypothetical protein
VATNVADDVTRYLEKVDADARPYVLQLAPSKLTLPRNTRFYAAHFKLDMMEQLGAMLHEDELLMVLDTDMLALRTVNEELLQRCQSTGVGAFDISDQEFSAYGDGRVIDDLETVAGARLQNPRWFGGEVLLASAGFVKELVPRAHACFERYRRVINELNHNGDEAFISAALNALADEGQVLIEVGAYQAVGRHWAGNNYRDLRWFRCCSFVHLPGSKALLEKEARFVEFVPDRFWRHMRVAHLRGRMRHAAKRIVRMLGGARGAMLSAYALRGAKS